MESLSLFTGIGGFDLGFEASGIKTNAMCEMDKRAISILKNHWPNVPIFENVRHLDGKQFQAIDVISGGFPCQDLSVAGSRKGLAGEKSSLWWEFYRIVSEAMPRWVVIENVAGLMSSGGRRDLGTIIGSLAKLGYMGGYRVLDAKYFGVPQRRRRIFIVGSLGNDGGQKVLFNPESLPRNSEKSEKKRQKVAGTLRAGTSRSGSRTDELDGHGCHVLVDESHGIQVPVPIDSENLSELQFVAFSENQRSEVRYEDLPTINVHGGKPGQGYAAVMDISNLSVRRLTPLECERLMGFPDNWTLKGVDGKLIADTPRYRLCGNAVVPAISKYLASGIVKF